MTHYTVKEIFLTQQGEGANIGRTAVFIRFSGCNLWSGREQDRHKAVCQFCDTDFVGGDRYSDAEALADSAESLWPGGDDAFRFTVLTGGEPLLQVDRALISALHDRGFEVAVETNGTQPIPEELDWVCVSPKAGSRLASPACADELKLVFPQPGAMPEHFTHFIAKHYWLSPMAGPDAANNTELAAAFCRANPRWRLAIQAHKHWSIP